MVKFEIPENLDGPTGPTGRFSILDMEMSEDEEFSKSQQSHDLVPTTETQSVEEQINMKVDLDTHTIGSFTMELLLSGLEDSIDLTAVVERVLLRCYTSEQSLVSVTQTGSLLERLRTPPGLIATRIFLWIEVRNAEAVIDTLNQDKKAAKVGYFQEEIVGECAALGTSGDVALEQLEVNTGCPSVPYVKVFDPSKENIPAAGITLKLDPTDELSRLGEDLSNLAPYLPPDIPLHYERPIRDAIFLLSLRARGRIYPHMLPRQCPEQVIRSGNTRAVLKVVKVCHRGNETTVEILVDRAHWTSRESFSVLRTRLDNLIDKAVGTDKQKRNKVEDNKRLFMRDRNFCALGPKGLIVRKDRSGNLGELQITRLGSRYFRLMGVEKGEDNLLHRLMACHQSLHTQPRTTGAEFIQKAAKEYITILTEEQLKVETKLETEQFALKRMYRKLRERVGVLTRDSFTKYLQNEMDFLPLESHRIFSRLHKAGNGEITQRDFLEGADLTLDEYKEGVELQLKRVLQLVSSDKKKECQGLLHFLNISVVVIQRLIHCFELATIFWPGNGEAGPLNPTAPLSPSSVVRVQKWLQNAVAKEVEKELHFLKLQEDSEDSVVEQIYVLLTGNKREDAAELAMSFGYHRIACLIASDNKAESRHFQNNIQREIDGCKDEGEWGSLSEPLKKIYLLLAGEFRPQKDASWFRALAQLSWFAEPLAGLPQLMNILNREISQGNVRKPDKDDILFSFIQGDPFDEFFDTLPFSLLEGLEWHFVDMLVHASQIDRLRSLFKELRAGDKEPRISRASLESLCLPHRNTEMLWRALTKLSGKDFIDFDNFASIFRRVKIYAPSCYEWVKEMWEDQLQRRPSAEGVNLPANIMLNLASYYTRCHVSCLETHGYLRWAAYCLIMTGRYPFHPDPALVRRIVRQKLYELETKAEKAEFRKHLKAHFPRLINSRI